MAPLVLVCGDPAQARRITEHLEDARHVGNRTLSRTDPDQNLNVLNLHSREMPVGADESGALLDTLASRADRLWPFETWPPMRFDRELSIGARGGHRRFTDEGGEQSRSRAGNCKMAAPGQGAAVGPQCVLGQESPAGEDDDLNVEAVVSKKKSDKSLYHPSYPPDPDQWLALDEAERIDRVRKYHRHAGERLPNPQLHATFHVIVETQIAMGDELPVRATVERLMAEGLDRHDAIHAIGSILAKHIFAGVEGGGQDREDPNLSYFAELETLTAEGWRQS